MTSKPTHRRRALATQSGYQVFDVSAGIMLPASPNKTYLSMVEEKMSTGHNLSQLGKGGDVGGPFWHYRREISCQGTGISTTCMSGTQIGDILSGIFYIRDPTGLNIWLNDVALTEVSDTSMNADGATAIARCNPDNPNFSFAQFLGELHEGIPRLCGSDFFRARAKRLKEAGSEYLNVQFGWLPFVSDLRNAAHSVVNSHEVIMQYQRDSGKPIRRSYDFSPVVSSSIATVNTGVSPNGPTSIPAQWDGPGNGNIYRNRTTTTTKRFSGAFTYYLDCGEDQLSKLHRHYQEAQHLLGIGLTPDVVWELTPWSWLADWYTNIGDVMTNARAFLSDGLVMIYGYQMEKTERIDEYSLQIANCFADGQSYSGGALVRAVTHKRLPANPFGFGLKKADLSPRQIAILAALGLILLL